MVRRLPIAVLIMPLLFAATGLQASPLCDRLFARLADLPEVIGTDEAPRDFSGALSRQNIDLRRARGERRALGCSSGSITVVNGENEEACADLDTRIDQMEQDLDTLKARRLHHLGGAPDDAVRRRVMVALKANRCEEAPDEILSASVGSPETHRNIIADLPPIGSDEMVLRGSPDLPVVDLRSLTETGPLRTMCVRTCDGSFFPISSDATLADFARDEDMCHRRCPGAETELYYHSLTTEETDQMVSAVTGKPYTALPTAFAYKTGDTASRGQCGCRPQPQADRKMSTPSGSSVVTITTSPPPAAERRATPAPAPVAVPETGDARQEALSVAPQPAPPAIERPYDPTARRVRQVGPTFLPAQESKIDLQHPAGPAFQPQQQTN